MPGLHELTISAIHRARQQGGTVDPIEDWASIAELDRLARACSDVPIEARLLFLDLPIVIGNVRLYRLSWGAMDWVTHCAGEWYRDDAALYDKALAWAHVHARSPGAFRRCSNQRDASAILSRWARGLSEPWQAIMAGVDTLLRELTSGVADPAKPKGDRTSDAPILESLMEQYGKPVDYWLWEISAPVFASLISAHQVRIDRINAGYGAVSGKAPDPDSHYAKATIRFQREAKSFVARVTARGGCP